MADAWGGSWGGAWGVSWGSGASPVSTAQTGGWVPRRKRKAEEPRRTPEWLREQVEAVYARMHGEVTDAPIVTEALKAYTDNYDAALPPIQAVDWAALAGDIQAVEALMAAIAVIEARFRDDEEAAMLLLSQ